MPHIDFWHDPASTYSWLAAMRIEDAAARCGVSVRWQPFLLGPAFARLGWATSPFNLQPEKGRYMWRDLERQAAALGAVLVRPNPFPQNGLLAARVALIGHDAGWGPAFTRTVYAAEFSEGRDISGREAVAALLERVDVAPDTVLDRATSTENKLRLKEQSDAAQRLGIFGAPTFVTADGEMFWGNDRLAEALYWARHGSLAGYAV